MASAFVSTVGFGKVVSRPAVQRSPFLGSSVGSAVLPANGDASGSVTTMRMYRGMGVMPGSVRCGPVFEPLIADMLASMATPATYAPAYAFAPSGELIDTGSAYVIRLELPGVPNESVKTSLKEEFLVISGEKVDKYAPKKEPQAEVKDAAAEVKDAAAEVKDEPAEVEAPAPTVRRQRFGSTAYGTFSKKIQLPKDANREAISATLKDGILEVTLPKAEAVTMDVPIAIRNDN